MDFATQRLNMVESQIRPSDVTDRRIVRAMASLPREDFVPDRYRALAYMDEDLPIVASTRTQPGRALMAPRVFAKLVNLAAVEAGDKVLDVGSAGGYSAAVLAALGARVVALESDAEQSARAVSVFAKLGIAGIETQTGPLDAGAPAAGPYDVIVIEGSVEEVPAALRAQLKDGGRLVAVLRRGSLGRAAIWRRSGDAMDRTDAFDAAAPALPGFELTPAFVF